jgi:TolB-like protein
MSFIKELKRRNVFRVGAAYVVVAWLIAQVSDLVLANFGAPDWVIKTVLYLLAAGLPVAVILAWAFELTPEGIKLDKVVDTGKTGRHARGIINRSDSAEQELFADGLTEEIINSLARTPDLDVASSVSSFTHKGSSEDVRTIAEALGVGHILEGSIQRSGDILRVRVRLIRASDGFDVWSDTYDRPFSDVIAIQEDIAIQIARALETAMDPVALAAMVSSGTHSVPAYEAYLNGLALRTRAYQNMDPALMIESARQFAIAAEADSQFTLAHYYGAEYWRIQALRNDPLSVVDDLSFDEMRRRFNDAISKAIEFENDSAVKAWYVAMQARFNLDYQRALRQLNEYLKLRPGDEDAFAEKLHIMRILKMYDEGVRLALQYVEGDVKPNRATYQFIQSMFYSSDPTITAEFTKVILNQIPDDVFLVYQAHKALLWAMDTEPARSLVPKILSGNFPVRTKALAQLRQACAEGRIADARLHHSQVIENTENLAAIWLAHKIIGNDDAAADVLREYDAQDRLEELGGILHYGELDPTILPNLMMRLAGQGIENGKVFEIPFRCSR